MNKKTPPLGPGMGIGLSPHLGHSGAGLWGWFNDGPSALCFPLFPFVSEKHVTHITTMVEV